MPRNIIVIGASAGGLRALSAIFSQLEPTREGTVFAVLHLSPQYPTFVDQILSKRSNMPVKFASNGAFVPGTIYIAPPDFHLIIEHGRMQLSQGPKENCARPAVDVTFRSAATVYRSAVIGVVLSGMLDDGTAGSFYIKRHGGTTIVQDPVDAEFPSMPANALAHVKIDYKLRLDEIAPTLNRLIQVPSAPLPSIRWEVATERSELEAIMLEQDKRSSVPTQFTCPDCHGPLSRIDDGSPTRFRCRIGHAYGQNSLHDAQSDFVERALWSSFQALEAKAELEESLREEAEARGDSAAVKTFSACIEETQRRIVRFAQLLETNVD
jgi:two-component system, chemotaxis family, protein-glutamate methylesterase/glutaminase